MWYIHIMEYYSTIKNKGPTISDNMDDTGGHYAK